MIDCQPVVVFTQKLNRNPTHGNFRDKVNNAEGCHDHLVSKPPSKCPPSQIFRTDN